MYSRTIPKTALERKLFDEAGKLRRDISLEHLISSGVLLNDLLGKSRALGVRTPIYLTTDPNVCTTACTDGTRKIINVRSPFIDGLQIHQCIEVARGENLHEDGHELCTDFVSDYRIMELIEQGTVPFSSDGYNDNELENLAEIDEFISDKTKTGASSVAGLYHDLMNIIEDAHIEPRMIDEAPGWGFKSLGLLRQLQAADAPYVEDLDDKEIGAAWVTIFLYYAKFGILNFDNSSHRLVKLILAIDDIIDYAIYNLNWMVRAENAWRIFVRLWQDVFKHLAENEEAHKAFSDAINNSSAAPNQSTGTGHGKQKNGMCSSSGPSSSARAKTRKAIKKADDNSNNNASGGTSNNSSNGQQKGEALTDGTSDDGDSPTGNKQNEERVDMEFDPNKKHEGTGERLSVSANETGRILDATGAAEIAQPDEMGNDDEYDFIEQDYDQTTSDIENLLKKAAMIGAQAAAEKALVSSLSAESRALPYTPIHADCKMSVKRVAEVTDKMRMAYDAIVKNPDVAQAIQTLTRQFQTLFKSPAYRRIKTSGTRLCKRKYKNEDINGRIFEKKAHDTPRIAIGVVIDESGSMSSKNRAYNARIFAIIIQAVCEALDIPVVIYGHMSPGSNCTLFAYTEFDSVDGNDKYRLVDISSHSAGNRDGAAVYFVGSRLAKRPEPIKILLSMSDGQPASDGYSGSNAEKDIQSIVQMFRRKGIITFGAAIGDDKDRIRKCYGGGFLDVTDVRSLPITMYNIVKAKIKN